jgi:SAM-dependent methyltransferase
MARVDYDRMARDYVEGRTLPPEGMLPWRDAIRPWVPTGKDGGAPALDLGAGTGQFAAAIAEWFGVRVVAVEPSAGMRSQGLRAHPHPRVAWVGGRGERLRLLADEAFAAGLAALDRDVAAETTPTPVVDGSTCWCCAGRASRWAGPSARGRGPRRPGRG